MNLLVDGNPIPGKDHHVTAQGQIERKDLYGQTSATAASHGGWKAWLLQVSVKMPIEKDGREASKELEHAAGMFRKMEMQWRLEQTGRLRTSKK